MFEGALPYRRLSAYPPLAQRNIQPRRCLPRWILAAGFAFAAATSSARAQTSSSVAELTDGTTSYELTGPADGSPVVLVHGVSGPMAVWNATAPALAAAGFRVLRFDLYGRGDSARVDADYTLALFERQLTELLAATGLAGKPLTLVGSSMGGMVVTHFQNEHPEQVRAIALLAPAGFPMKMPFAATFVKIPGVGEALMALFGEGLLKERNREYFQKPDAYPAVIAAYESQLGKDGTNAAMLSTWRNVPLEDFTAGYEKLAASPIPKLLIWGKGDVSIPFANAAKAQAVLKDATFHAAEGGHLPQLEAAELVNDALIKLAR